MEISIPSFRALALRCPLAEMRTIALVRRNYCGRLSLNNFCPARCTDCRPKLEDAFRRVQDGRSRSPGARLSVQLRDVAGAFADEASAARIHTGRHDEFGQPINGTDPFGAFLKQLDEQRSLPGLSEGARELEAGPDGCNSPPLERPIAGPHPSEYASPHTIPHHGPPLRCKGGPSSFRRQQKP